MSIQDRLVGSYVPSELTVVISHPATGVTMVIGGYQNDSAIDIERGEAAWTGQTGVDGFYSRSHNIDQTNMVTLHLNQASASNDFLTRLYEYDRTHFRGEGLFTCAITDKSGRSKTYSDTAFVSTLPNQSFANATAVRDWIITMPYADTHIGGNTLIAPDVLATLQALGQTVPEDWILQQ